MKSWQYSVIVPSIIFGLASLAARKPAYSQDSPVDKFNRLVSTNQGLTNNPTRTEQTSTAPPIKTPPKDVRLPNILGMIRSVLNRILEPIYNFLGGVRSATPTVRPAL